MQTLKEICTDALISNIKRYSRTPACLWSMRHYPSIGQNILDGCMSSAMIGKMDGPCFDFIIRNFKVYDVWLSAELLENIDNVNCLCGKEYDSLEIDMFSNIQLTTSQFHLTTNKLNLSQCLSMRKFLQSSEFFTGINVVKEIMLNLPFDENVPNFDQEKLVLTMLRNTSLDIEQIDIPYENPSMDFIKEFQEIIKPRRKIKNLKVRFDEKTFAEPLIMMRSMLQTRKILPIELQISNDSSGQSLKNFEFIEDLTIFCHNNDASSTKKREYLEILKTLELKNCKRLYFSLSISAKENADFETFLNLCSELTCFKTDHIFSPSKQLSFAKKLKRLHIKDLFIVCNKTFRDYKELIHQFNVEELVLDIEYIIKDFYHLLFEPVNAMIDTLTSIKISCLPEQEIIYNYLPEPIMKSEKVKKSLYIRYCEMM